MKRINQTRYEFESGDAALTVSDGQVYIGVCYAALTPKKARELGGILSAAACEAESQVEAQAAEIEAAR